MPLIFHTWKEDIIFFAVALIVLLAYRLYKLFTFFDHTGIPYLSIWKSLRINLKLLSRNMSFLEFIDEVYKQAPDKEAVGYLQFLSPVVMIRDPELVQKVLITDFAYFHDHGIQVDEKVNPLDGHLFSMSGRKWRSLRNRLSPVFTSGRLKHMFPQVMSKTEHLARVLPDDGKEFKVREYLSRYAIDVIGCCAFGVEAGALDDPECEFRKMALKIFNPKPLMIFKTLCRVFAPKLAIALKLRTVEQSVEDFFFSITKQAFEHRSKTGEKRGDFVDLLLQLRGKGKLEIQGGPDTEETELLDMTDELLTAQSFIFLVAGWETVTTGMNYTFYFISKHQDCQQKLREELEGLGELTYESLRDAPYLNACIYESLRILSPGGALLRVCNREYRLSDGSKIEQGTTVVIPGHPIQRDPKYFPGDPLEFRPERFLEMGPDGIIPGTFIPFGDGPRICIAQRFAMMEMRTSIAYMVKNYRLRLGPSIQEPITIDPKSFVNDMKGSLWIKLEKVKS